MGLNEVEINWIHACGDNYKGLQANKKIRPENNYVQNFLQKKKAALHR